MKINIISKSGTTIEPAIAFRILKDHMEKKYCKDEASKRVYVTTDRTKGALKDLSNQEGYKTFVIPDDVGGIDIGSLMEGGQVATRDLSVHKLEDNSAYRYALIRNLLYSKGKTIGVMVSYEPNLFYLGEWYKQLFGESEEKDGKGIFPTSLNFTTDLHSMGQYIQDCRKVIFETILNVEKSKDELLIMEDLDDLDGLNYLSGKSLDFVNKKAMEGTIEVHVDGGVPNLIINIPEISPYYLGYLIYFLEGVDRYKMLS